MDLVPDLDILIKDLDIGTESVIVLNWGKNTVKKLILELGDSSIKYHH